MIGRTVAAAPVRPAVGVGSVVSALLCGIVVSAFAACAPDSSSARDAGSDDAADDRFEVPTTCGDGTLDPGEDCDGPDRQECTTACETVGFRDCGTDCRWTPCAEDWPEECNGSDDDCNGLVDESIWCPMSIGSSDTFLLGVWGASPGDVWVVGGVGVALHWNGAGWARHDDVTQWWVYGVWGASSDDVWVAGERSIAHWDGTAWTDLFRSPSGPWWLRTVAGSSATDVWAAGDEGVILHWTGSDWRAVPDPTPALLVWRIWALSTREAWAVGDATLRWNGTAWSDVSDALPVSSAGLGGVSGSSDDDIWLVGLGGTIVHWDGASWSVVPGGTSADLTAVWAGSPRDAWAVGENGTIVRWNGSNWTQEESGTEVTLADVWGSSPADVWIVGDQGTVLRRQD